MKLKKDTAVMTLAKNEVFIGWQHENCYLVGDMNLRWGRNENLMEGTLLGGFFSVGR